MTASPTVLAKAETPYVNIIAVTNSTSKIGYRICEQASAAGATVYALDAEPTALAHLAISFRKKQLPLRVVPCDLTQQISIEDAIDEITNHAPPIDLWIHADKLTTSSIRKLPVALATFSKHFKVRGKGIARFISETDSEGQSEIKSQLIKANLIAISEVINYPIKSELSPGLVSQLLRSNNQL